MTVKLCFYVPPSHLESVKHALFAAGAGKIGDYEACCWQTLGTGQFKPLASSQPYIGTAGGEAETVEEYKVELVCANDKLGEAIRALRTAHPYEEPAYDIIAMIDPQTL